MRYSEGPQDFSRVPFMRIQRVLGAAPIRASDPGQPAMLPGGLDHYEGVIGFQAGEFEARVEGLVLEWHTHMPLTEMDMLAAASCGHDHPALRDPLVCAYHQVTIDVRGKPIHLRMPLSREWLEIHPHSVGNPFRFAGQVSVIFIASGSMLFQLGGWDSGRG